ncbi:hypothetical protein TNCV_2858651 [Trichonephila clavipes]|nr:hypothetical protein TNCV_2858651 [Trichonephila clavipes]
MCTVVIHYPERNEAHRHFREGRKSVEDDGCSGRPQTFRFAENIEKIYKAESKKRLQKIAQIAARHDADFFRTGGRKKKKICMKSDLHITESDLHDLDESEITG